MSAENARGLPPAVPKHWLWGNARELIRGGYSFLAGAAEAHGGIARFHVMRKPAIVLTDVDLIEQVLVKNATAFPKSAIYRNLERLLGAGLVTHEGDTWQQHRRVIQPGFHRQAIGQLVNVVNDAMAARFDAKTAASAAPIDVVAEMRAVTQQVISEVLLGTPVDAWRGAKFTENFYEGQRLLARRNWGPVRWPDWMPTPVNRGIRRIHDEIQSFLDERIDARLAAGVGQRGDMLDLLLLGQQDPASPLSRDDVLGEMSTLFSAGYDTTSSALAWAMYFLATHPETQARLHAELDAAIGERAPTWEDLDALEYTGRVLDETMRLHPPIHSLSREAREAVELGGYTIPAGMNVMISIYGVQRSLRYWPDAETFDPERFANGSPRAGHPKAFMPFSIGRRRCIGANFAMTESKLVLANLGRRFSWRLADASQDVRALPGLTHYPATFHVRLEPRSRRTAFVSA